MKIRMQAMMIEDHDGNLISVATLRDLNKTLKEENEELELRLSTLKMTLVRIKKICLEIENSLIRHGLSQRPVHALPRLVPMRRGEFVKYQAFALLTNSIRKIVNNA